MIDKEREIRERLEAQGVKVGSWTQRAEKEVRPQFSGNMLSLLKQLREVIQGQVASDAEKIEQLREAVHRAKYGGGR